PTASITNDNGLALSCSVPSTTLTASGGTSYSWSDGSTVVGTNAGLTVTTAGTFTVTVTGANGCTDTASVTTTLDNTAPTAEAGTTAELTCGTTTLTLDGSGSTGQGVLSYAWTTADGTIDSGANTASPVVSAAGTYSLIVTDADNGCSSVADTVVITEDLTAPNVTVVSQTTNDTTPVITGTCNSVDTITVTVDGVTYTEADGNLTDKGDNTWTLTVPAVNAISPDGTYDVVVSNGTCSDVTAGELILDTTAPTADTFTSNDTTPTLTGTGEAN
ncbi:PKD domain-containing protein, partial [Tenacibaculum soleae]|uniref:PKD domain-containing protein n=1 Tax=Tenacibaculum soleae TaxID=447689 RepID=UPI002300B153